MQVENQPVQEISGWYGDKEFNNTNELFALVNNTPETVQAILDKIKNLVNAG